MAVPNRIILFLTTNINCL